MKKDHGTVRVEQASIDKVKAVIIGTGYSIGSFVAEAVQEKILKDKIKASK